MMQPLKARVRVRPDGTLRLESSGLPAGAEAEVIVLVEASGASSLAKPKKMTELIGAGGGLFKSVEEVDAYINELRDEWVR
jgi:hypothetical protein